MKQLLVLFFLIWLIIGTVACTAEATPEPSPAPLVAIERSLPTATYPPAPTSTIVPTTSPTAAVTATTAATATASSTPAATATATFFPSATPTETPTPAPTPCAFPVSGVFRTTWENHANQLGCASDSGREVQMVAENFQYGRMFWRSDNRIIYAVYNSGQWTSYTDQWVEGNAEFSCGAGSSPLTPRRGFGKVWCENNSVRQGLGEAVDAEYAVSGIIQSYRGGIMIQVGGRTFVFYNNGTWR